MNGDPALKAEQYNLGVKNYRGGDMSNLEKRVDRLEESITPCHDKLAACLKIYWRVAYAAGRAKEPEPSSDDVQAFADELIARYGEDAPSHPVSSIARWMSDRRLSANPPARPPE